LNRAHYSHAIKVDLSRSTDFGHIILKSWQTVGLLRFPQEFLSDVQAFCPSKIVSTAYVQFDESINLHFQEKEIWT